LFQLGAMPDFTTKVETADEEDDEEEEEDGEDGEPADDDFETAWDILDVARVIFEKSEDKDTQLKLADVHLCLGDVSLETGKCVEKSTKNG
jgi:HAT1-interacting factor 1